MAKLVIKFYKQVGFSKLTAMEFVCRGKMDVLI